MQHRGNDQVITTTHYNVKLIGGGLFNRITGRYFLDLKANQIEWVYIVEERRHATAQEVKQLCGGRAPKPVSRAK